MDVTVGSRKFTSSFRDMFFMNNKKNMETSKRSKAVTIEQLYIYVAPISNVLLRIAKYTTYYSVQVLLLCSKPIVYKALSDKE